MAASHPLALPAPSIRRFLPGPAGLTFACGAVLVVLGPLVIAGWIFQIPFLVSVCPGFSPMPVWGALCFALSGAGLLALASTRLRVAGSLGGLLLALTAAMLLEYIKGIDLGIARFPVDPGRFIHSGYSGRLPFSAAACFALVGLCLLIQGVAPAERTRVAIAWLAGSLLIAASGIALLRYLPAVREFWSPTHRVALHGGAAMLLLGIGLIAGATRNGREAPRGLAGWLPIPVGIATAAAALLLWYGLLASAQEQAVAETQRTAVHLQAALAEKISIRVRSLGRMALRMERRPDMPRADWQADAEAMVQQEGTYQAIEWADASLRVRWAALAAEGEPPIGTNLEEGERERAAVERALASRDAVLSLPVALRRGEEGFLILRPLYPNGRLQGMLAGVFRLNPLFDELFANGTFAGYRIAVMDGDRELYRYGEDGGQGWSPRRCVLPFAYDGLRLELVVEPSPGLLASWRSRLPNVILGLGIALAAALMLTVSALQRARLRSRETAAANAILERRMVERTGQLHQSEESFRFLADLLPHLVWTARPDGGINFVNRRSEEYAGVNRSALLERGWVDFVYPGDLPELEKRWAEALRSGLPYDIEYRLRRADGAYRWHLVQAHAQHGGTGEIVRWVGSCTDIHDQREARAVLEDVIARRTADLAASEEQFRHAFEHAGIGMALVGLDGAWLRVNRTLRGIVGYTEEELLGKTFQEITHPADLDADLEQVRQLLEGKSASYQMAKRYFHRDGHVVWVRLTASLVRDGRGRPLHFVAQIEDVTARVRTEEALRESEERFRLLTARAPIGILLADKDGRILYANPRWREMAGLNLLESPGRDWTRVLHPDDRASVSAAWEEMIEKGGEFAREFRFSAPGGRLRWVQARAAAVRGSGGEITGYVGTNADITELKDLEQRLLSQNAVLELETARAQEANRLKSEFLSNMSHELRTPLNGIIGFSEFLHDGKAGPLGAQQVEFLGDVLSSARHLLQLINDLLDVAKIEAGRMELSPRKFSLSEAVGEICASLHPLFLEKQLAFFVSVEAGEDDVVLDPGKFRQILYNLLSNAIKFTPPKGSIDLRLLPVEGDPGRFQVRVRDTGIGIKPEDFKRLFGEFQQLDSGVNRRYQGSGLGLALTRKLAVLHGGTVGVESVFGEGSTFTVVLPRTVAMNGHA